ncbi:MAG: hypothetical protein NT149_02255 [Candidatus Gottesmanbacteria bacterium]|nr:hypothetical protein [Candidatus Gottesmanbacteria bacterium]
MATIDDLKKMRLAKLAKLKKLGADPYPGTIIRKQTIAKARSGGNRTGDGRARSR